MTSPLIDALTEDHGMPVVSAETLDAFAERVPVAVLFFSGDPDRLWEANDVAVVLPELKKALGDGAEFCVIDRASERELQLRYRFNAFPTLVFLANGQYLGAISRMQDWADYLEQIAEILARKPSEPPAFVFPEGCGVTAQANSAAATNGAAR